MSSVAPSTGRGVEPRPQRDQEPLLRDQGGAAGDAGEGQARGAPGHAVVPPHRRDLPLQMVGQPAQPQAVHGSQQHPPHVGTHPPGSRTSDLIGDLHHWLFSSGGPDGPECLFGPPTSSTRNRH